ncbi:hypothetical protein K1719_015832 [Acacia pycnantha]|nr:hypothetical protein K1719_015832 [Acacia pycnantha]
MATPPVKEKIGSEVNTSTIQKREVFLSDSDGEDKVKTTSRPSDHQETRWKSCMVKRSRNNSKKRLTVNSCTNNKYKQERFLLTNGNSAIVPTVSVLDGFSVSSPKVKTLQKEMKIAEEEDDGYWSAALEEIRWDSMFQDLKPN